MAQPTLRIGSVLAANQAAAALETPSDVRAFEAMSPASEPVRAFLATPEWAAIRTRIVGDGTPPLGRPESLVDLARLFRWSADGAFSEELPSEEVRAAYLHAAAEIDAFSRGARRIAPTSPAVGSVEYVPGLGGRSVAVPRPADAHVVEAAAAASFADALVAAQCGRHIAREAWGPGAYVTAQAAYPQGIGVNANTALATGLPEGSVAAFEPYLMMRLADVPGERMMPPPPPRFVPWTPGQDDLFARDWRVLSVGKG